MRDRRGPRVHEPHAPRTRCPPARRAGAAPRGAAAARHGIRRRARMAKTADAVLVGRRGVTTKESALGRTVISLIRIAERCVIVCGGVPSPMRSIAVAFDGRDTSRRALELAIQFATVVESTIH